MKLSYSQFEVLTFIEKNNKGKFSQRDLSDKIGLSLGTINKTISDLTTEKYIKEKNQCFEITELGLKVLEPYRVKRAIFLAAGFGSRLVPITFNTPKPLVRVNGVRMIETLLDAVIEADIPEIIIVTGYLSEQFEVLKNKYNNIKFVENGIYNESNNISSAYMVRDKLCNAYVMEADLCLYNKNLIRKYEYQSNFLGKYVDRTDDWCFEAKNGYITKQKVGGVNCYQMYGISYYDEKDGKQIREDIEKVFNSPGGKEKYWEQVLLDVYKKNYKIAVRECHEGDIIEIDTFNELKQVDSVYDV